VVIQANLVNMETGQQEPNYPAGLWHHVAKVGVPDWGSISTAAPTSGHL